MPIHKFITVVFRYRMQVGKQNETPETISGNISPVFRFKIKYAPAPVPILFETTPRLAIIIPADTGQIEIGSPPIRNSPVITPECQQVLSFIIKWDIFTGIDK